MEAEKRAAQDSDSLNGSPPNSSPVQFVHVTNDIAPAAIAKIVLTGAGIWLLIQVWPVIVVVTLALMFVATFNPLVRKLQKRLGRNWALAGVIVGLLLLLLATLALLLPVLAGQGTNLLQHAPQYAAQFQKMLAAHGIHVKLQQQVERFLANTNGVSPQIMGLLSGAVNGVTAFVTVSILTIYLLIEGPEVGTSMSRLLPRKKRLGARKLVAQIGIQVGGYMRGQLTTSALAGAFSCVTLWIVGVPEALALGALAAIADAIPFIGLLIALFPAALMALSLSPVKAGIVVTAYLIYHQLESHVIAPRVYGNTLGLSLSAIVISLLVGAELMGALGAVLALPVAAALPSIVTYIQEWQEDRDAPNTTTSLP